METTVVRRRAPTVGEHTDEVLGELGFSTTEIAKLRDSGAIA
jgi:crotonobetainyl-CoA:carnitine CoA-transferase CaiB-like acyl-CoA transferase